MIESKQVRDRKNPKNWLTYEKTTQNSGDQKEPLEIIQSYFPAQAESDQVAQGHVHLGFECILL